MKRSVMSLVFIALLSTPAFAQEVAEQPAGPQFHNIMLYIIGAMVFAMVILTYALYHVVNMLKHEVLGIKYSHETKQEEVPFWEKVLSLKPLANEKDIELDHDFDGIKELNNPIPAWFNFLFYGTIAIGVIYFVVYHITDSAPLQAKEYENELMAAKIARAEYIKTAGNLVDENTVVKLEDAALIAQGQELFTSKCAVCHGDKGEGKVGPNLTDAYWLHGGDVQSVFKTIKYGVPAKGMVAWQNSLNGGQIQQLTSFILTLQGTNPAGAKEPQGEIFQQSSTDTTITSK